MKIGVIGSGTWGMALSLLLNDNGHQVRLWSAIPTEVEALNTKKSIPTFRVSPSRMRLKSPEIWKAPSAGWTFWFCRCRPFLPGRRRAR